MKAREFLKLFKCSFKEFCYFVQFKPIKMVNSRCAVPYCRSGYDEKRANNKILGVKNEYLFSMPKVSVSSILKIGTVCCPV